MLLSCEKFQNLIKIICQYDEFEKNIVNVNYCTGTHKYRVPGFIHFSQYNQEGKKLESTA